MPISNFDQTLKHVTQARNFDIIILSTFYTANHASSKFSYNGAAALQILHKLNQTIMGKLG
jgi:hypothetical protein